MIIISCIFCIFSAYSQNYNTLFADTVYPFIKWEKADIDQANTASGADYLTEEEKKVIFLCNLARINGKLFNETFLAKYLAESEIKDDSYVVSLKKDLKKTKKLQCLVPAEDLFNIAKKYAIEAGQKGWEGHRNYTTRFKAVKDKYFSTGENCAYGFDEATEIVITLLIDQNISDLGHRKNILNKDFSNIGVSIQPHKDYEVNCVMDFGAKLIYKKKQL